MQHRQQPVGERGTRLLACFMVFAAPSFHRCPRELKRESVLRALKCKPTDIEAQLVPPIVHPGREGKWDLAEGELATIPQLPSCSLFRLFSPWPTFPIPKPLRLRSGDDDGSPLPIVGALSFRFCNIETVVFIKRCVIRATGACARIGKHYLMHGKRLVRVGGPASIYF